MPEPKTSAAAKATLARAEVRLLKQLLAPPPDITVTQWADAHRVLSREASAEPGQWRTDRAPYLRGIMDAFSDPLIERIVFMKPSQVGATEIINNIVGYFVDQDPAPLLVLQPTLDMARAWSTDRLAPMLRDSPRLQGRVKDPRTRDSGNTILHKLFDGGHLTIVGANSAAGLAMRPIRVVLCDEVDRYPPSAGTEGDPVTLAFRRTATFWNRKLFLGSTPTVKGFSRIEQAYLESDQRTYHVPCPHCGLAQPLVWSQLKWETDRPETAAYLCLGCGVLVEDAAKTDMLERGVWVAAEPGRTSAGFHLNGLYSPWARWAELAREFLEVRPIPERLRVFVNTVFAETWTEAGDEVPMDALALRRERYAAEVPRDVGVLTAAVDVQGDRLELEVIGWGKSEESWRISWEQLPGDPGREEVWQALEGRLTRAYRHEGGAYLHIAACCIDSGGHHTEQVYRFVRPRQGRRVYATKGLAQPGRPLLGRPSRANKLGVRLFPVGTDTAKDLLFARLKITQPGPGYCHFPDVFDHEFFAQLTSEKAVTRYYKGRPIRSYVKQRPRNEVLDLEVLNLVALASLGSATLRDLGVYVERAQAAGAAAPQSGDAPPVPTMPVPPAPARQDPMLQQLRRPGRAGGGWVNSWRS